MRLYSVAATASLVLGSIDLRKGVAPMFEAIRLLRGEAVEFWFVGPSRVAIPDDMRSCPNVRWVGAVPRSETGRYYRDADVFLFPTFSDGFGLTQLEAQAWKLPIIATKYCGEVVKDGVNGIVLAEPTGMAIATAVRRCLADPGWMALLATNAVPPDRFSLKEIGEQFLKIMD